MQKFIFDLDNTLVRCDFVKEENKYFGSVLSSDEMDKLFPKLQGLLGEYELAHSNYDLDVFSSFLTDKSGVLITKSCIKGWIDSLKEAPSTIEPYALEVLEYLKHKDKSIVLLTNWFRDSQEQRLINSGLFEYFDEIYSGDTYLKPSSISFTNACGYTPKEDCIMIGDDYIKDYLGAIEAGIKALHYTDTDDIKNDKIKSLKKIMELY